MTSISPGQLTGSAGQTIASVLTETPVSCTQSTPPTLGPADATEAVRPNTTRNNGSCFIWPQPPRKIRSPTTGTRRSTRKPLLARRSHHRVGHHPIESTPDPAVRKDKTRVLHRACRFRLLTGEGYREIPPPPQAPFSTALVAAAPRQTAQVPRTPRARRNWAQRRNWVQRRRKPAPIHEDRGRRTLSEVSGDQGGTKRSLPSSHSTTGNGS